MLYSTPNGRKTLLLIGIGRGCHRRQKVESKRELDRKQDLIEREVGRLKQRCRAATKYDRKGFYFLVGPEPEGLAKLGLAIVD